MKTTLVKVCGQGVSIWIRGISKAKKVKLTKTGISEDEYQNLIYEMRDEDCYIFGPLVENTSVIIGNDTFDCSSPEDIERYKNSARIDNLFDSVNSDGCLIVLEATDGDWFSDDVTDYSHDKLSLIASRVKVDRDTEYLLFDNIHYDGETSDSETWGECSAFVVDGQGLRTEVRIKN